MDKQQFITDEPVFDLLTDLTESQLEEISEIKNPSGRESGAETEEDIDFVYVNYPWRNSSIKTVNGDWFYKLKTNRNQMLIRDADQQHLRGLKISIAGMSIGSSIFYSLVGSGIGSSFCLADDDSFSTSNLNRVYATLLDVGKGKCLVAKQKALEMDPFIAVDTIEARLVPGNLDRFTYNSEADIIIEEIDDFKMKVGLRRYAQDNGIPLMMVTNLGDSITVDLERHDLGQTEIFNGLVSESTIKAIDDAESISQELMKKISLELVKPEFITSDIIETIGLIGSELVGRPQLFGTVTRGGGLSAYMLRKIFDQKNPLPSGRYSLSIEDLSVE